MSRSRLLVALIVTLMLFAACAAHPDATVSIAGQRVDLVLSSATERTLWSGTHGDYAYQPILTVVRAAVPVSIRVETGQGTTRVRGWIYDVAAPTPSGGPIEEFTLPGEGGAHQSRSIAAARTYQVLVNVTWSALVGSGEVTYVFHVRIDPP